MTPADMQQLLITHAPRVPGIGHRASGIADAGKRSDDSPYGPTVTLVAVAMAGDVVRVDRYSTRPGAARPEQPYQPLSHM